VDDENESHKDDDVRVVEGKRLCLQLTLRIFISR